ncbi:MAG TPA: DUF6622 family protein [Magnetospirillaceae bacterium]|jgi:hypothetical protein
MDMLSGIVEHTPTWVFVVFALLVMMGVQSMRPRRVRLVRLLITPAIFIVWGIVSLTSKHAFSTMLLTDWLVTAAVGIAIAGALVRFHALRADRQRLIVQVPGSRLPLIRNVTIFAAKYALAVAAVVATSAADQVAFLDVAVSGLCVGYFLGWLGRLMMAYRHAPALDESVVIAPGAAS